MHSRLTTQSIFHHWQTPAMLLVFFGIRAASFLLEPHPFIQALLVFLILMLLAVLYFKNPDWAWYLVIGELFLGGAGHYLEFINLSIRTLVVATFLILWLLHSVAQEKVRERTHVEKYLSIFLITLLFFVGFAVVNGMWNGHNFKLILQDLLPFLYIPLVFPAFHLFFKPKTQEFFVRLIIVFLIGSAIFSVFTYILFSAGIVELQEPFYKWFRDIAAGKITSMGAGFFRIVLPEHLIITPITLVITSLLMRDERHHKMWRILLFLAITILVLNFSRIHLLALLLGLVVLKYKHSWKRWLIISTTTVGMFILIFTSFFIVGSGGKSLGWELFGVRITSLAMPQTETSSATRMMILPEALEMVKDNPILGVGLGATITFRNSNTYEMVTTRQFDWGYLEMIAELGALGALALLSLIFFAIKKLLTKIKNAPDWHDFYVGLLAGVVAMLVINLTAPALFHVFGIIFLVLVIAVSLKPESAFERTIDLLYRIFNRFKHS